MAAQQIWHVAYTYVDQNPIRTLTIAAYQANPRLPR